MRYTIMKKQPILIVELNFCGAFPVWWKPWLWVKFWYFHLVENEAWVESWLGLLGTDWCLDIVESESSDEAFWAAGSSVPPCPPPARQHRPRLQGDQAQVWPAEDGREWVQLTSPPNLFIWHFHRQGQRRRSAQAPLASPGGWEPTSPLSRERGWESFMKSFFSSEISCHLCFWKTLKLVFSPPLLWFCTYWTIPNFWCIELWIPFEKSVTFFEFDVVHQSPRRDGACNPNPAIIWIQRIKLFLLVQTCSWKSFLSLSLSFDQSFLTLSLSQSPLQYWMFSVRSYTVLKRSGKNCQIQPPFSSLSLKSKRIWTLSFRHNIYGILYLDHGGVWEAEPQYVHLWGLWVNVQCTMQVIWGYSVHMYHAGYLGHNRVWDTVCQGTSQQHQHQPDLQSCITQECSRFFSWQFTINLWR